MMDDQKTKDRFGYLASNLTHGSSKRVVYLCHNCGKEGEIKRYRYKEGHVCVGCGYLKQQISQQAIKEDILRVAKLLGHQPTAKEYEKLGKHSIITARSRFGQNWRGVLSVIGLKVKRRPRDSYSLEEVTKDLIAVKTKLGFIPTEEQYLELGEISINAIKYTTKCNRWVDIVEKVLGVSREEGNFHRVGNYQTTEQHLEKIRQLAKKLGHTPSREQAQDSSIYVAEIVKRLKTNWIGIIKAAGLDPEHLPDRSRALFATKEDMIKDLQRVARLLGKAPGNREYKEHGNYAINTVKGRLGTWQESLEAAGLDLTSRYENKKDNIFKPTDYYLAKLRELAQELGRAPKTQEALEYGITTYILYDRLKTDWAGILTTAGIDYLSLPSISLMNYVSNYEAIEDITKVANIIGHKPSIKEYQKHGIYSPRAIIKRFNGKWTNVLEEVKLVEIKPLTDLEQPMIKQPKSLLPKKPLLDEADLLQQESANNIKHFFGKESVK